MIRGSHLDITVLGGMEVSQDGDLANWIIPEKLVKGMGGAMDLVSGTKKVIVAMEHLTKNGEKKIHKVCRLPITGRRVVNMLITEMAVFEFVDGHMFLKEVAEGVSVEKVKESTDCEFHICPDLKTF
jgi:3-oxoacid CoA-transferase subunit B